MRVNAYEEWTANAERPALIANGLGNGQHMPFVERRIKCTSAVPRGSESNPLCSNRRVRLLVVVGRNEPVHIDKLSGSCEFAGEGADVATQAQFSGNFRVFCNLLARGSKHMFDIESKVRQHGLPWSREAEAAHGNDGSLWSHITVPTQRGRRFD